MSTESTLSHRLRAFGEGVDAIMDDYTDGSVLFTPDGPLTGPEPIRTFFDGLLRNSPPALLRAMTLSRRDVQGDVAYVLWKADPFLPLATDTFVIRGGRVVALSFAVLATAPAPESGDAVRRP